MKLQPMIKPSDAFPVVSQDLVERLALLFPDRCPVPAMTDRDVWIAVGEARVVKFLTHQVSGTME